MKHCHCGLKSHFHSLKAKKLGLVGVILIVLHVLFHVVECLIVPALFVAFSGHSDDSSATAAESSEVVELAP